MAYVLCTQDREASKVDSRGSTEGLTDRNPDSVSWMSGWNLESVSFVVNRGELPWGWAVYRKDFFQEVCVLTQSPSWGRWLRSWGHQIRFVASSLCCKNTGQFSEGSPPRCWWQQQLKSSKARGHFPRREGRQILTSEFQQVQE